MNSATVRALASPAAAGQPAERGGRRPMRNKFSQHDLNIPSSLPEDQGKKEQTTLMTARSSRQVTSEIAGARKARRFGFPGTFILIFT